LQQLQWHLAGSGAKGEVATDFDPPLHPYTHPWHIDWWAHARPGL